MNKLLILASLMTSVTVFSQDSIRSNQKIDSVYESSDFLEKYGFRNRFYIAFDRDKVNGNKTEKSEATFTVNSEGKITNIKTTGTNISMNKEVERTLNQINKFKLIPPKNLNGKPIDSIYKFPVEITFVE